MSTNTASLIVPINIEALCVGNSDVNGSGPTPYGTKDFANIAADFSQLPYVDEQGNVVNKGANISESALPGSFEPASELLQPGIHLHWALPDALTHGISDGKDKITFPEAPNRWLVARIASNHTTPTSPITSQKAWIVESDYLWDKEMTGENELIKQNTHSRAVPTNPMRGSFDTYPNKAFKTLGRVFPYETWSEQTKKTDNTALGVTTHTALGYGIPTYAAVYVHCPNVFGFYDMLDDLDLTRFDPATSKISYMVTGWYSDPQDDPLIRIAYPQNADQATKKAEIEKVYKWTWQADVGAGTPVPTRMLCNGLLCEIPWDPDHTQYIKPRPDTPLEVAIGNTTAEALSALLANKKEFASLNYVERVLNALQLSLLSRLGQPGGLADIDEYLHQHGFGSGVSGQIWMIKRKTVGNSSDGSPVTVTGQALLDTATTLQQTLPENLAHALNLLNITQQQIDTLQFEIDSRRAQVFADWYKYMLLQYRPLGERIPDNLSGNDAFHFIQEEIQTLGNKLHDLDQLMSNVTSRKSDLESKLGTNYFLTSIGAPRYWQANDPVLLLSGEDVQASDRHGGDGRFDPRGFLVCRLSSSLLSAMMVHADHPFTVQASNLPQLPNSQNQSYEDELKVLLGEAFFLDPNQAWMLAHAIATQGGTGNPASSDLNTFVQTIQAAQNNLFQDHPVPAPITFTGKVPSKVGFQHWATPWIPLIMQWEVLYYPTQFIQPGAGTDYGHDFLTSNYQLNDDLIDLVTNQSVSIQESNFETYQGTVLLAQNTEIDLTGQIDAYLKYYPNDEHAQELQTIRNQLNLSMMAQALDGFNQALLMRKQTLQLPVSDPLANKLFGSMHSRFSNGTVKDAVKDQNNTAPMPLNSYSPLRAGLMNITRLRIIDAFGQVREIKIGENHPVFVAESLKPRSAGKQPTSPIINLPPRITQTGRLLFRWLSAADDLVEMNSHPASTPICGWVLFNHLDDSLVIYDAGGIPLGSLNINGPLWQGAPGNNDTYEQPVEVVFAKANSHLKNFVLGICHHPNGVDFLRDLLAAIDRTMININPLSYKQDPGLSVLIGWPLALVRASLKLDLQGLPALDQSWSAFTTAVSAPPESDKRDTANRDAAGFPDVQFPVRIGDLSQGDDGLIGYFLDDGAENAYQKFYAAASQSTGHGVVPPAFDQVGVRASKDAPELLLSLLIDPRAPVHATTGIVPVKEIAIPPDMYVEALKRIIVTFLIAPILSSATTLSIPVPKEQGFAWSWITRDRAPTAIDPHASSWTVLPRIADANASAQAALAYPPQQISEGWLQLFQTSPQPTDGK